MSAFTLKLNESLVYNDDISLKINSIHSKFAWFNHEFFMEAGKSSAVKLNNKYKLFLNENNITINTSSLKLVADDENQPKNPIIVNFQLNKFNPFITILNIPDFVCNYVSVTTIDENEREKSVLHDVSKDLDIGQYTVKFTDINNRKVSFEIYNPHNGKSSST